MLKLFFRFCSLITTCRRYQTFSFQLSLGRWLTLQSQTSLRKLYHWIGSNRNFSISIVTPFLFLSTAHRLEEIRYSIDFYYFYFNYYYCSWKNLLFLCPYKLTNISVWPRALWTTTKSLCYASHVYSRIFNVLIIELRNSSFSTDFIFRCFILKTAQPSLILSLVQNIGYKLGPVIVMVSEHFPKLSRPKQTMKVVK